MVRERKMPGFTRRGWGERQFSAYAQRVPDVTYRVGHRPTLTVAPEFRTIPPTRGLLRNNTKTI